MAQERISMRKIKEALRLYYEAKVSQNNIAKVTSISRHSAQQYLLRFKASGLIWPLTEEISESELEKRLFPGKKNLSGKRPELDYGYLLQEIRKPNATLGVLWEEYKQQNPAGYQYSYFCDLFNEYRNSVNSSMRQEHKAGEKTFVDFGESGIKITDSVTGKETTTKIYVSVWGASTYMYAESSFSEGLEDWINLNVNALEYFGCCSKAIVPDNLKSAVNKACKYEPELNPTYAEFAQHYGTVIYPARPYKPKDKSKAENGIKLAKRWILFRLRNRVFYSLFELNQAIWELLKQFNNKRMKKFNKSRWELFEQLDKPHALSLPTTRYEFAEWDRSKVQFNYHVNYDRHDYSVPYTLIHKQIEIRASAKMIEIFYHNNRIYSHVRSHVEHGYTTIFSHMPPSHQKYLEWTPERIKNWAKRYGPSVIALVEKIMESRKFPEQAYKSCLGIIRLENKFTAERLNLACLRALEYRAYSYRSVVNILQRGLDKQPLSNISQNKQQIHHENIRGAQYYSNPEGEYINAHTNIN
jgi:transposase